MRCAVYCCSKVGRELEENEAVLEEEELLLAEEEEAEGFGGRMPEWDGGCCCAMVSSRGKEWVEVDTEGRGETKEEIEVNRYD